MVLSVVVELSRRAIRAQDALAETQDTGGMGREELSVLRRSWRHIQSPPKVPGQGAVRRQWLLSLVKHCNAVLALSGGSLRARRWPAICGVALA